MKTTSWWRLSLPSHAQVPSVARQRPSLTRSTTATTGSSRTLLVDAAVSFARSFSGAGGSRAVVVVSNQRRATTTTMTMMAMSMRRNPPPLPWLLARSYAAAAAATTTTGGGSSSSSPPPGEEKKSKVELAVEAAKLEAGLEREFSTAEALKPPEKPKEKTTLWQKVKEGAHHYYIGTKLFLKNIRISSRLLRYVMRGQKLTRRERRQLVRTTGDMFRLVPFLVFVIVPFMEFLLPVALKLFPNMLPSTFEDTKTKDENRRKLLKVRLEMAKFLQETVEETAVVTAAGSDKKDPNYFKEFFNKIRNGEEVQTEDIVRFAKTFEDELTLDNLTRPQLVSLCRFLELNTFGTTQLLRYQIENKFKQLKEDDKAIMEEGVDSLNVLELQSACVARGMRTIGVSTIRLRAQLQQWLDLQIVQEIPITLLMLSRAFMLQEDAAGQNMEDMQKVLTTTLQSLPDEVIHEVQMEVAGSVGLHVNSEKLELIEEQEELIEQEREEAEREKEEKAKAAAAATEPLVDTAPILEEATKGEAIEGKAEEQDAVGEERRSLEDLKESRVDYKEDLEALQEIKEEVTESAASSRLGKRVEKMIDKLEKEVVALESAPPSEEQQSDDSNAKKSNSESQADSLNGATAQTSGGNGKPSGSPPATGTGSGTGTGTGTQAGTGTGTGVPNEHSKF